MCCHHHRLTQSLNPSRLLARPIPPVLITGVLVGFPVLRLLPDGIRLVRTADRYPEQPGRPEVDGLVRVVIEILELVLVRDVEGTCAVLLAVGLVGVQRSTAFGTWLTHWSRLS